jgi:hypothetical protein
MPHDPLSPVTLAVFLATSLIAAGCSGNSQPDASALAPSSNTPSSTGGYQLTEEEKALDCKKLTGRMQVRILQARDYSTQQKTSAASRALQGAVVATGSAAKRGIDPDSDHSQDRVQLEAYNQQLAALKCRTFNLDEDLKPKAGNITPRPVGDIAGGVPASGDGRANIAIPVDKIGIKNVKKPEAPQPQ